MSYSAGDLKRDPATGNVAIRTVFPEDDPQMAKMAWLVATPNIGAIHATSADVADWDDIAVSSGS